MEHCFRVSISDRRRLVPCLVSVAASFLAYQARSATLTDVAYFTSRPDTLVTFEQRGDGSPTPTSNFTPLPFTEYSASGFTFCTGLSPGTAWINDSGSSDTSQAIGGSLPLAIGATDNQGDFFIHFAPRPVAAFGFWVLHSNQRTGIPTFDAIGTNGILESAFFTSPAIDGSSGNIDYGFLGIAAAAPIHSIHIRGDIALLDNFRFIAVPEPLGALPFFLSCMALCLGTINRKRLVESASEITTTLQRTPVQRRERNSQQPKQVNLLLNRSPHVSESNDISTIALRDRSNNCSWQIAEIEMQVYHASHWLKNREILLR